MNPDWLNKYPGNSVVHKAYEFASDAHKDVKRVSGDPYITHCIEVSKTVHDWGMDESSIAAALLHDVVEDTGYTTKDIDKRFGKEIAFLVNGLTKLEKIQYPTKDPNVENLRKLILSFSKDLRVIIIKLADRLHNMKTLKFLTSEQKARIAWETTEIYSPLAYRLGMQKLSGDLEDLAFPYLHPEEHAWLLQTVEEEYTDRVAYTERIKPVLEKAIVSGRINVISIDSRAKRYSSLYKKLQRYEMDIEKIYDLVALRIIVNTVEDCYATLGIIHKIWPPLPGRIKDYIARPKPNGYRSIHTTVFCLDNRITEFQIRTQEMHDEAELGIAAHWAYEQIKNSAEKTKDWTGVGSRKELLWVEQLRNWQKSFNNQSDFIESLKIDFFKDRIFVITPQNDVIDLPVGATPVDFAYHIHSEIGDGCVGAKINGKLVTLDYKLRSGDIVEIMTQKGKKPSEDWLRFAQTSLAKENIRSALRSKFGIQTKTKETPHMEFKIINQDKSGYLKDVTAAFGESKINITYLNSVTDKRGVFSIVTIKTGVLPKLKLEQILVRLKKITGSKEVSYKFNR
ncbi:MAG: RelA/SpoT family protein [Patescibacteria group bacterium]